MLDSGGILTLSLVLYLGEYKFVHVSPGIVSHSTQLNLKYKNGISAYF